MLYLLEMLGGMLILGRIATAYVPTYEAQAQVHPGVSGFHALFADMRFGGFNLDLIEVCTSVVHIDVSQKTVISGQVTSVILRKAKLREKELLSGSQ